MHSEQQEITASPTIPFTQQNNMARTSYRLIRTGSRRTVKVGRDRGIVVGETAAPINLPLAFRRSGQPC
jgi:hypothetical protein